VELINGSGVDLSVFTQQPFNSGVPIIILAARLLKDKGVKEFIVAAKLVNINNNRARFALVGEPDFDNPASIQRYELENWESEGIIELWGHREDMEKVISLSTIVVLPSYREGFPKILIEAAACGRPIVTTDVPGCRDAIDKDITGIIVPVQDYLELAKKISFLLDNPFLSRKMGNAGRIRAEEIFDINKVVQKHMNIYEDLSNRALA
jgi:glycosyltransferase involved in cell wall biosynthesis